MFGRSAFGDAVATKTVPLVATQIAMPKVKQNQVQQDCNKLHGDLLRVVANDSGYQCKTWVPKGTFDYQRECATVHVQRGDEWRTIVLNTFVDAYNRGGQPELVELWTCLVYIIQQLSTLGEAQAKIALAPLVNQAEQMTRHTRPATSTDRQPQRVTAPVSPASTTKDVSLIPQQHEVPSTTTTKVVPETQKYEVPLEPTEKVVTMPPSETAPIPPVTEPGMAPVPPWTNGADWGAVQAAQCIVQGGTWTGAECVLPKPTPVTVTVAEDKPNYLLYGAIGIGVIGLGVGIYALTRR